MIRIHPEITEPVPNKLGSAANAGKAIPHLRPHRTKRVSDMSVSEWEAFCDELLSSPCFQPRKDSNGRLHQSLVLPDIPECLTSVYCPDLSHKAPSCLDGDGIDEKAFVERARKNIRLLVPALLRTISNIGRDPT
jgi:hypothetical protein